MTTLEEAIAARDKFLEDRPHLVAYQKEIDAILEKVPESQRAEVLHQLALGKMMDMHEAVLALSKELKNAYTVSS